MDEFRVSNRAKAEIAKFIENLKDETKTKIMARLASARIVICNEDGWENLKNTDSWSVINEGEKDIWSFLLIKEGLTIYRAKVTAIETDEGTVDVMVTLINLFKRGLSTE